MSYTATIVDPHDADAVPWWESHGHADVQAAMQAARTHVDATHPADRIGDDDGHGVHAIFTGPTSETRIATLVITPTDDDVSAAPTAPPTR
jgi:hypothetical protein